VQQAIDTRTLDQRLLLMVAVGHIIAGVLTNVLNRLKRYTTRPLNKHINRHFSIHVFEGSARLDVPTFNDSSIQKHLQDVKPGGSSAAFITVNNFLHFARTGITLFTQVGVLLHVLKSQRDGVSLALMSVAHSVFQWYTMFITPRQQRFNRKSTIASGQLDSVNG
jgi:hypothetical protein